MLWWMELLKWSAPITCVLPDLRGHDAYLDDDNLVFFSLISRGHGTYLDDDNLTASVAGEVERVDKLICVKPLKTR